MRAGRVALCALLLLGCGYRSVYSAPSAQLSVRPVRSLQANAQAALALEQALREELAREGALASGARCPCVQIEVLRVDHTGAALRAGAHPAASSQLVAVLARAQIVDDNQQLLVDAGEVRAEVYSAEQALSAELVREDEVVRAAARRAGLALARRLLGHPSASAEATGFAE